MQISLAKAAVRERPERLAIVFCLETLRTWQKVSRHSKVCGKLRLKCFSFVQSLRTLGFVHGQERTVEFPVRLCSHMVLLM